MPGTNSNPEIQWRCPDCLAVNGGPAPSPGVGPWTCSKCGKAQPAHPEALGGDPDGAGAGGDLVGCPVCGCRDLYRQRDFNRKLGVAIVLLGAALSPWTYYLSIIGCVLIDVAIYSLTRDCAACYRCHAILRGYAGTEKIEPFDLNVSEKYIDVERRRGW